MGGTAVEGGSVPDEAVRPFWDAADGGVVVEVAAVVARHLGLLDFSSDEGDSLRHSVVSS